MSSSLISRPGRLLPALGMALGLALPAAGAAAPMAIHRPSSGSFEPRNVSARTLALWRWRESLDQKRAAEAAGLVAPSAASALADDPAEILLNDTTGTLGTQQDQLAVASQPGHNIVLVWRDNRGGDTDIYAQLLSASGQPLTAPQGDGVTSEFLVNDDGQEADQRQPAVAMNANGDFVIAWSDTRNSSVDIFMQRYQADGTPVGGNLQLSSNESARFSHFQPSVALDDRGNVAAAWLDDRSQVSTDIYAVRLNPDNSFKSQPFQVSGNFGYGTAELVQDNNVAPVVAFPRITPEDTSLVVAWQGSERQSRGGRRDIFVRLMARFAAGRGTPSDTLLAVANERIFVDTTAALISDARAASRPALLPPPPGDDAGTITLAWADSSRSNGEIRGRVLRARDWLQGLSPFAAPSVRISDQDAAGAGSPGLARLSDGTLVAGWALAEGGGAWQSVHARLLNPDLSPIAAGQVVNSGSEADPRGTVRLTAFGTDQEPRAFLAAWVQTRPASQDIVLRAMGSAASSDSTLVRDRQPDHINADVAGNSGGQSVVVWTDFRGGRANPDIYGQRLNADGAPVGTNFRVDGDTATDYAEHPRVAIDGQGAFTVVWEDARNGNMQVYARRFGSDGTPAGPDFPIAPVDSTDQFRPAISMTPTGSAVVVWEDSRRGFPGTTTLHPFDIYMLPLNSDGTALGNAVRVSPLLGDTTLVSDPTSTNLAPKLNPSVALDPQGNGLVIWDVATVSQVAGILTAISNVNGRAIAAPSQLPPMLDADGRGLSGQAFVLADTIAAVAPQTHGRAAYVGSGMYAVTYEDERLGFTSREDIAAQVLQIAITGDSAHVYMPKVSFLVNDDTVALPPDPVTRIVAYVSASQYDPAVTGDPDNGIFSVVWTDRRPTGVGTAATRTSYNIMRQVYKVTPAADPTQPPRVRHLSRNTFINSDSTANGLVHGVARAAFTSGSRMVTVWQSPSGGSMDIYSRTLGLPPDTCSNDECRAAPSASLEARIEGDHAVSLSWQLPAPAAGSRSLGTCQLLRYDLASYATDRSSVPLQLASIGINELSSRMEDQLPGAPSNYLYELMRDGQVLASAMPSVPSRFYLRLAAAAPNPARGLTRIQFVVPGRAGERVETRLRIYDVNGRVVRTLAEGTRTPGVYSVSWQGEAQGGGRAASGVYFVRMEAAGQSQSQKLLWMR